MNKQVEQIRAEIVRRIDGCYRADGRIAPPRTRNAIVLDEFRDLLSFIDSLPEQPDGLEEEVKRYWKEEMPFVLKSDLNDIARHFYELGQQSRPKISDNSLEEEIAEMYQALFGTDIINRKEMLYLETFNAIARHFSEWQKAKMMEEAVEGRIGQAGFHNSIYIKEPEWCDTLDKLNNGDKVRVIVIKEDEK